MLASCRPYKGVIPLLWIFGPSCAPVADQRWPRQPGRRLFPLRC